VGVIRGGLGVRSPLARSRGRALIGDMEATLSSGIAWGRGHKGQSGGGSKNAGDKEDIGIR